MFTRFKSLEKYLNCKNPFDLILMADLSMLDKDNLKKIINYYKLEHATLIKNIKNKNNKIRVVDIAVIDEINMRLRHSEKKLAEFFKTLEI